jgi:choline kinase
MKLLISTEKLVPNRLLESIVTLKPKSVKTALLLAAGTGSRLRPLTLDAPKCLTVVGGKPILERLVESLCGQGIEKLIVVTGYLDNCIRDFLQRYKSDLEVEYVFNPDYQTTNNIYSLWLARSAIKESFLLVECDLVFDPSMLNGMMQPNKIAVSNILPWMNGTTVEINSDKSVTSFEVGQDQNHTPRYKTVNIYSLSLGSWNKVVDRLAGYISGERLGEYYEAVFADMIADGILNFDAVLFDENRWYEVDRIEDLHAAELMFPSPVESAKETLINNLAQLVPVVAPVAG